MNYNAAQRTQIGLESPKNIFEYFSAIRIQNGIERRIDVFNKNDK
jgi:hypothetical protein